MKTLLAILLFVPVLIQAQLSQDLSKRFPAHILYKIDEINSKVNLTPEKQIKIGQKLFIADSLANISLIKGGSISKLKSYYTIDTSFLKSILSAEELDNYGYEMNKDNRFLVALKYADQLKLSSTQIGELRKENDQLKTTSIVSKMDIEFYDNKLTKILSDQQLTSLLGIIYKEQSVIEAKKDWSKIKQLNLVTDEKNEYSKVVSYHTVKNILLDPKSKKYDKNKIEELTNKVSLHEPSILIHANILSDGIYKKNEYSSIIKYEKELGLTKNQTDTLLSKYVQLEFIRVKNKERELTAILLQQEPSEYANIIKILTPEQIDLWLSKKLNDHATKVALRNWKKIVAEGLHHGLDKDSTILEFSNYQIKFMVADEKTRMYNTQEYAFYKRDIEQKKPDLLKQLDAIAKSKSKGTYVKNNLTW